MRSSSSCLARMTVSGGASYSRRRCARREAEATVGVATIEVRALVSSVGGAPKRAGLVPGRRPAEFDAVARSAGRCAASPFGTLDASSARFPKTPFSTLKAASSVCRRSRQPREELAGDLRGRLASENPSSASAVKAFLLDPAGCGSASVEPSSPSRTASGCSGRNMAKLGGRVLR